MVTLCWAAKGGSGTTVIVAALALRSERPALLVDLDGELPAVLGMREPDGPGVSDWLSSDAPTAHLADLTVDIGHHVSLLPHRRLTVRHHRDPASSQQGQRDERWALLAEWLGEQSRAGLDVFVDAGTGDPHPALVASADRCLLVTRLCYLALCRARQAPTSSTGVIVVSEPGRILSTRDVENSTGAPVVATVHLDPAVARAIDSGLLTSRLPKVIVRDLRRAAA